MRLSCLHCGENINFRVWADDDGEMSAVDVTVEDIETLEVDHVENIQCAKCDVWAPLGSFISRDELGYSRVDHHGEPIHTEDWIRILLA